MTSAPLRGGEESLDPLLHGDLHGSLSAARLLAEMMGELPRGKGTFAMLDGGKLPLLIIDRPMAAQDG